VAVHCQDDSSINTIVAITITITITVCVFRFQLSVTSRRGSASGFAVLTLEPAPPEPSNGSCTAVVDGSESLVAVALIDRVTVSCSGWQDHSDTASLLEYYVFINDSVKDLGDGRQSYHWYPVYRGV